MSESPDIIAVANAWSHIRNDPRALPGAAVVYLEKHAARIADALLIAVEALEKAEKFKWVSCIYANGKRKWLGSFKDEKKAALAYDIEATWLFGSFAYLNFPHTDGK